jgi:polyisoprenoid-binding protein YceI
VRRFKVVPGSSSVEIEVRSSLHPIHSRSTDLRGVIEGEFDDEGRPRFDLPHAAWVEIPVSAISSGSRLNDIEMQRRAEVGRYPNIRFEVTGGRMVDGQNRGRAAVDVSAHGRTQSIEEGFQLQLDGRRVVVEGQHTFDMRDFGVNPPRIFTLKVEPEVRVTVRLVADEDEGQEVTK